MTLGDKLRKLILSKNPSIKAFAEKIGMNGNQVSAFINDRVQPSIGFLNIMINEFPEVDLNWLLRNDENMIDFVSEHPLKYSIPPLNSVEKIDQIKILLEEIRLDLPQK